MGTPSSSVLSPRATCEQTTCIARYLANHRRRNKMSSRQQISNITIVIIHTTIITLSWNIILEIKTQKMSYKKAQLRRAEPT
jgi:hypothetical protein